MLRGRWLLIILVVLAGLMAGAVALLRQEGRVRSPARPAASNERSRPEPVIISLPARIQARQVLPIAAQVSGIIQEFGADVGQDVYEGQLLARIGNQQLESARENAASATENARERISKLQSSVVAARLEASRSRADAERSRSEMESADQAYQRQKMLLAEGATPRLVYEESEKEAASARSEFQSLDTLASHAEERVAAMVAELDNAKKALADRLRQLEDAQEHLRAGEVYSPVNGLVVARRGDVGKPFGDDGDHELFRIAVDTWELQAVLEAEPSALARLAVGQEAMLFFADIRGEGIPGTVAEIQENQALVHFTSPSPIIKPGMTTQVRITLQ